MNYDFILKAFAIAIICVLAQVAVGRIVHRFRVKPDGELGVASSRSGREEVRWAIATLIVVLLLAVLGEAVWRRWQSGRRTHAQLPLVERS